MPPLLLPELPPLLEPEPPSNMLLGRQKPVRFEHVSPVGHMGLLGSHA